MNRGFTLIESLLYLALYALLMGGIIGAAYVLFESADRSEQAAMIREEQEFITGKIDYLLADAQSVAVSPASLQITSFDGSIHTCSLANHALDLDGQPLNNSNTSVTDLVFLHGSDPEYVEAGFTINATTSGGLPMIRSASTTVYLAE